jgi:hypothetical protein
MDVSADYSEAVHGFGPPRELRQEFEAVAVTLRGGSWPPVHTGTASARRALGAPVGLGVTCVVLSCPRVERGGWEEVAVSTCMLGFHYDYDGFLLPALLVLLALLVLPALLVVPDLRGLLGLALGSSRAFCICEEGRGGLAACTLALTYFHHESSSVKSGWPYDLALAGAVQASGTGLA